MPQISKQPDPFIGQTLIDGLTTGIGSATAVALVSSETPCSGVEIRAVDGYVYVGNSTSQNRLMAPLETLYIPIDDVSKVYTKAASSTVSVSYFATY